MKIQEVPLRAMARWFQAAEILSDVDADGHDINNFDGTQNPAMAWNSIGSGIHPWRARDSTTRSWHRT